MTITKLEILAHNFSCNFEFTRMKKSYSIIVAASIFMLLILRYGLMNCPTIPIGDSYLNNVLYSNSTNPLEWLNTSPAEQTPLEKHTTNPLEWVNTTSPAEQKPIEKHFTNPLEWLNATSPAEEEPFEKHSTDFFEWLNTTSPAVQNPENVSQVVATEKIVSSLFAQRNISHEEQQTLGTWKLLKNLTNQGQGLPNAVDAITEAGGAWNILMDSVEEHRLGFTNESSSGRMKQCPHFLSKMNGTEIDSNGYKLRVPCGLTQGSSVTVIGIPNGILGNFQIDFTGEPLPGEPEPPIILHYSVRLNGDKLTEDPVIVQNSWTIAHDWGEEERCPSPTPEKSKKVDELDNCNKIVGTTGGQRIHSNVSRRSSVQDGSKPRTYFPFKQGYPFVATLRVGSEGIQMTVDGKQITSFAIRETLESWLVSEVRVSGDLQLISVLASGLPTSEDSEHIVNLEELKSAPLSLHKQLDLFIGVFSTANNFKQRMAVRRTWMLYAPVKSGAASAVRFFVGLHKNQIVNEELWNEAQTYGDIQLMPFVDYYGLITWKTLAICIYGTEVVSAKFVMKTDDDAFVRVDEVLASLNRINVTSGLLYGLINSDSRPHRNPNSKWYISPEEWSEEKYPPWAHGPGYVVSSDIAKAVSQRYKNGSLKMFKLEDVAMGIWVADMKKEGLNVHYEKEKKVYNEGCKDGYIVAHYQGPREMLCLWQKIQEGQVAKCCGVQKS